jgi:hypothetical protein
MSRRAPPVPVGEVVIAAYRSVFGRFSLALELGWLPLLVVLAGIVLPDLALRYLVPAAAAATTGTTSLFDNTDIGNIGELAISILALSAFAVRWYQLQLLGDPRVLPARRWLRAWLSFAAYGLAILALCTGLYALFAWGSAMPAETAAGVALVKAVAVSALLIGITRISLVFPAAAYGAPLDPAAAWHALGGNVWRLAGANVLVMLPVVFSFSLVTSAVLTAAGVDEETIATTPLPLGVILFGGVAQALASFVMVALAASTASEFYRRIVVRRERGE